MTNTTPKRPAKPVPARPPIARPTGLAATLAAVSGHAVDAVADAWYRLAATLRDRSLTLLLGWLGGLAALLLWRRW